MRDYRTTETPPAPTAEEKKLWWRGKIGTQHARKNKLTGLIERWWTDGDGSWSNYAKDDEMYFKAAPTK